MKVPDTLGGWEIDCIAIFILASYLPRVDLVTEKEEEDPSDEENVKGGHQEASIEFDMQKDYLPFYIIKTIFHSRQYFIGSYSKSHFLYTVLINRKYDVMSFLQSYSSATKYLL